jgi:hypothetical protein
MMRLRLAGHAANHHLRLSAKRMFQTAVKNGLIERRGSCEHCASERHVDGHHEDYAKPLDVIWLCRSCHHKRHLELGRLQLAS